MLDQGAARTWPHPAWPEVGFAGRDDAYHAAAQCVDNHKHLPFDHAHQPKSFFAVIMPCIGLRDAIWMAESRLHSYPLLADNTDMVFVELPIFVRCAAELFSDEDIAGLQNILLKNPDVGDLIPGGRGLRKLRVPLPGRGSVVGPA